eukprot:COSAG01_NODE_23_length_37704_cov_30.005877_13_plen_82_part_00
MARLVPPAVTEIHLQFFAPSAAESNRHATNRGAGWDSLTFLPHDQAGTATHLAPAGALRIPLCFRLFIIMIRTKEMGRNLG